VHPLVLAAYSAIFILTPLAGTTMLVDRPPCAATLLPQSAVTPGQGRVHYAHHVRRLTQEETRVYSYSAVDEDDAAGTAHPALRRGRGGARHARAPAPSRR